MVNLSTKYMGISLKNPIVVGASNLVQDVKNLRKLEEAGAGAIVYKSLFEEQIQLESLEMQHDLQSYSHWDAEKASIFPDLQHAGPAEFLHHLKRARQEVSIPLIASLNAVYEESWVEYAQKLAETGVDGLELNFYANANKLNEKPLEIETRQVEILKKIKSVVKLPVSVKLSPYYTNTLRMVYKLDRANADGFVLFNRLFQPDIDIEKEVHTHPYNFSTSNDGGLALRYAGMLHGEVHGSVVASTGILTGEDMVKMLLAGADAVQVVTALYKKGFGQIGNMLEFLEQWMETKGYTQLSDFRGKLSRKATKNPFTYKRAQYVDILMHSDELFKPLSESADEEI